MTPDIDQYILDHISPEPQQLRELYRHTHLHRLYPRMCSGHLQGRILKMLTAMVSPKRVIELGTYTGYSALCIAEALAADAELHTVEIDDEWADEIRATFDASPFGDRITLHIGDALSLIPVIGGEWDMAYIDANKRNYIEYLDALMPRMIPGGFIIADNTLWDGKVADTATSHDAQTMALARFNDYVARHPGLETVILPIRDGLTIMRVISKQ
ncbi:MAG: O-methyltransferase [Duncaniella sp.]|nr:O-methyltransferase [Duncaniella sp.]